MDTLLLKALVTVGSAATIGFGLWHFSVPAYWKWYSYMDPSATELVLAVRATNVFFSLSLVLFGIVNLLLVHRPLPERYSLVVVLGASCLLWATRVAMQVASPQGSMSPALRYGMLAAFAGVLACHALSLALVLFGGSPA